MFAENISNLLDLFKSQTVALTVPFADGLTEYVLTERWDEDAVLRGGPLYYLWSRDVGTAHQCLVFTGFTYDNLETAKDAIECFNSDEVWEKIEEERELRNRLNGDPYGQDAWM